MSNNLIRIAATSSPHRVAGAIAHRMRVEMQAEVQAIGPVAVNQMVKAVILACSYLQVEQIEPVFVPSFVDVSVDGQMRTAVHLLIRPDIRKTNVANHPTFHYNVCTVEKPP